MKFTYYVPRITFNGEEGTVFELALFLLVGLGVYFFTRRNK
jgi:hypothetical protein